VTGERPDVSGKPKTRRYRKIKRAIREQETRRRIVDALVHLHATVGPANATITEVAARAGVSRMTVYNHFPDEATQFAACSAHWFARHPLPDLEAWAALSGQTGRLLLGLRELYCWYRDTHYMMDNVLRDAAVVPAVADVLDRQWWPYVDRMVDVLLDRWKKGGKPQQRRVAIRLMVDFRTWQILTADGMGDEQAARLAAGMVQGAAQCSAEPAKD
jgi:AcrR family transcriptional regulator